MSKTTEGSESGFEEASSGAKQSKSAQIARAGLSTSDDMKRLMATLIPDILDGEVSITAANATCNAAGKLIKVVELELKYGREGAPTKRKSLKPNSLQLVADESG